MTKWCYPSNYDTLTVLTLSKMVATTNAFKTTQN